MSYNPSVHHRRSIRLKEYDYSQNGMYFITVCVQNKECLFGKIVNDKLELNDTGKMIEKWWHELTNKFPNIELDKYIIMPNHLHGIIQIVGAIHESPNLVLPNRVQQWAHHDAPLRERSLLSKIIGYFKMNSTKTIHAINPNLSVWQRNYYEHIIRNEQSLEEIREYIVNNPLNWGNDQNNPKM